MESGKVYDLLVIGGGINGAGIALDAAGRGLSVVLCEQNDLGSGTSSCSTKLIHGGLRYLEQYDFKLVREALSERELLMRKAPHLISPLTFILPYSNNYRPKWMIQFGLWLYDHLGKASSLPRSKTLHPTLQSPYLTPVAGSVNTLFSYSDCWVDDARLVISNALGASQLGAQIYPHTQVTEIHAHNNCWEVSVYDKYRLISGTIRARMIVNATGPWIKSFIDKQSCLPHELKVRLVRGSHIIVPRRYIGDHAYLIQHKDGRIIFVIPYEQAFTLIGTTEVETLDPPDQVHISEDEKNYLIAAFNEHFTHKINQSDILWTYSGVRPLVEEEGVSNTALSRDYVLDVQEIQGAPILSVYGGKITTYRTLAEAAVDKLKPYSPSMRKAWTAQSTLPGGDIPLGSFEHFMQSLEKKYPWAPTPMLERLAHQHGTRIHLILSHAQSLSDLGEHFGADCYEKELKYYMTHEWAHSIEDLLFRRTKLGLHLSPDEVARIKDWLPSAL